MNYTTVYVGMDVHKESFTLACYTNEKEDIYDACLAVGLEGCIKIRNGACEIIGIGLELIVLGGGIRGGLGRIFLLGDLACGFLGS